MLSLPAAITCRWHAIPRALQARETLARRIKARQALRRPDPELPGAACAEANHIVVRQAARICRVVAVVGEDIGRRIEFVQPVLFRPEPEQPGAVFIDSSDGWKDQPGHAGNA